MGDKYRICEGGKNNHGLDIMSHDVNYGEDISGALPMIVLQGSSAAFIMNFFGRLTEVRETND